MSANSLRLGDSLPLALVLPDGAVGKFPQAEVYGLAGTLLNTYDLTHRAKGLYTNNGQTMPAEAWVTVLYITYDNAGHSVESTAHRRTSDTFFTAAWMETGDAIDGATTVGNALANASAVARNKIIKTGDLYTVRNRANDGDLFANTDNANERTPT